MSEHSTLVGGSTAERFIECIGSDALIKKMPKDDRSSEAAQLGTALHYLTEVVLDGEEDVDPLDFIDQEVELDEQDKDGKPIVVTMREIDIAEKLIPAITWFDNVLHPMDYWLEQKVSFDGVLEGAHGTADVLYHDGIEAGIVDWKFGENKKVSAEDNYQLKFYLAAALKNGWFGVGVDEFHAYIVQPLHSNPLHPDDIAEVASHAVYTREELEDFEAELTEAKRKKDAGDTTLTCGSHCDWCPAQVICTAWRDRGSKAVAPFAKAHVSTGKTKAGKPKKPVIGKTVEAVALDADIKATYLEMKEIAKWCDAVDKYVKGVFADGGSVEGLKRVDYSAERQFTDEKTTLNWVRRQGLKAADYYEPQKLKSVAKIEKLVGVGNVKETLYKKVPKGYSIVDDKDPRPSASKNPADVSQQLAASLPKK